MSLQIGSKPVVVDNLVLYLDAGNKNSLDSSLITNNTPPTSWNDGKTWNYKSAYSPTYGDNKFVIGFYDTSAGGGAMYSQDGGSSGSGDEVIGETWTYVDDATQTPVHEGGWVAFGYSTSLSRFVAVSRIGNVMYSSDGKDWTAATAPYGSTSNQWQGVVYGNDKWVAVSKNGNYRVMYSTTGTGTWISASTPDGNSGDWWWDVAYGDGKFVAVAYNGTGPRIMYSSNGTSWGSSNVTGFDSTLSWNGITYANGMFIACATGGSPAPSSGNEKIIYSTDGINWSNDGVTGVPNATWRKVSYHNGYWVACGDLGETLSDGSTRSPMRIMYSKDALEWTPLKYSTNTQNTWYGIGAGENRFVVSGYNTSGATQYAVMYSNEVNYTEVGDYGWNDLSQNVTKGLTINGATPNASGYLSFNGSGDNVNAYTALSDSFWQGNYTVSIWIYFTSIDSDVNGQIIFEHGKDSNYNGLHIMQRESKVALALWGTALTSTSTVSASTWYNLAFTLNNTTNACQIYINGSLDASSTLASSYVGTGSNCSIGGVVIGGTNHDYLDGRIDKILCYNRVLTAAEVKQNFDVHKGRFGL